MKRGVVFLLAIFLIASAAAPIVAQSTPMVPSTEAAGQDFNLTIPTAQAWSDTGIDLRPGDVLEIRTTAPAATSRQESISSPTSSCDPEGASGSSASNLPVTSAFPGALIGKLHEQGAMPFFVGLRKQLKVDEQARLYLGVNANGDPPCHGAFAVKVHRISSATAENSPASGNTKSKLQAAAQTWLAGQLEMAQGGSTSEGTGSGAISSSDGNLHGAASSATGPVRVSPTPLDAKLRQVIDKLPRRVTDQFNNLGDMVNFVIIGSEKDVRSALEAANWFVADRNNAEAAAKAVIMTYEKKDYLEMPMSLLYLFGRAQDFGYEQAEPYSVVASRHHFRLWKAPFEFDGQPLWVGAGTHDIGFEKDQRNGRVTHKIDPAVDGERDHIAQTIEKAGKAKMVSYYLPPNPVEEAKNATGGGYHSDGRIVVICLTGTGNGEK